MIKLRDYQQILYDQTKLAFSYGRCRVLIQAPCGAGKSFIFAKMVSDTLSKHSGEVLILIHRQELLLQHTELFKSLEIPMDSVRIESVFTEVNHMEEHPKPSLIVLDEAHLSRANSWIKVIDYYKSPVIAFTATPCRLDGKPLGDIYDCMIQGPTVKQLIADRKLSPYKYYAPTMVDVSNLRKVAGDYTAKDTEPLMMDKKLYGDIISSYRKLADGKKSIAYCVSVKHSKQIAELFSSNGIPAAHIDGATNSAERKQIMEDFRAGRIKVLCNCSIISEGVSIDDCECCLLLRPTDSLALFIQSSMRCMRYQEGKTAIILDFVGNYTRHGLPDDDRKWRLDKAVSRKSEFNTSGEYTVRQCPQCFRTFKTAQKCPYCGYEYQPKGRELEQIQEVELKRIGEMEKQEVEKQKKLARMEVGMARTYDDLWAIARARGYKPGWIYHMAKIKGIRK